MARRTFTVVDVVEILTHGMGADRRLRWPAVGADRNTVRRYVAAAEAAGLSPGGPPIGEEQWRTRVREWFPQLTDSPAPAELGRDRAPRARRGAEGVVPASVIHQRRGTSRGWKPAWPACAAHAAPFR